MPNEQVDPASGALSVVATDLVLPGNAGLDLRVQRFYSSHLYPRYDDGNTVLDEDSWAGIGWTLHFGRVLDPHSTNAGASQIEMGDGSRHPLYHAAGGGWTTAQFWLYDKTTHTLRLPNGVVYVFGREVEHGGTLGVVRYVTEIRDVFDNRLTFTYFSSPGPLDGVWKVQQHLSATQVREVEFSYDPVLHSLATMTYAGRTWTYTQAAVGPPGFSVLRSATPPVGRGWQYEYTGTLAGELTRLQAPSGGHLTYVYGDATRLAGPVSQTSRVVQSRATGGPQITPGTWTYTYGTGANQDTTVVSCPCGTIRYRFNGTGVSATPWAWAAGTLAQLVVEDQGVVLETRTYTYQRSEPISSDPLAGVDGMWSDDAVYRPLLAMVTTQRGTSAWTTVNHYHTGQGTFNDYGQPYYIEQGGENVTVWRRITRTFQYGFTPYIANRVVAETVQMGQVPVSSVSSSWSYNLATGFLDSQTLTGVTSTFEPTSQGNVGAVVDGLGHRTTFAYDWGRVSGVVTPQQVNSTYAIAPEGYVQSATTAGLTTGYVYDAALRLTRIQPPGGVHAIVPEYDNVHGRFVRIARDQAQTEDQLDGFGRAVLSFNRVGVKSRVTLDACGRVTFASLPYTAGTGTAGTTTVYDALGRVRSVTDPASQITSYTYTGATVTRLDAEQRTTVFEHVAYGDPSDTRLAYVTDATGQRTGYRYDVTGALVSVEGPGAGVTRSWVIDSRGLPLSDTQPESGTTTYVHDAVGNLTSTTDANGQTTTLTYDANHRLTFRNAPGTAEDLTVTYDTSGPGTGQVQTLSVPGTTTTLEYDAAGRPSSRTDQTPVGAKTSHYAYDLNDNLTQLTYPSGRIVAYDYDIEHRLLRVRQNGAVFAESFTYDEGGRPAGYVTGAVNHAFTYEAGRTKRILAAGPNGTLDLTYGYDGVGNVTSMADPRYPLQHFTADALDRLTAATGPWGSVAWTYDATGNRLSETAAGTSTAFHYQAATQRLTSTSGAALETFTYDSVGQLINDLMGQYTYSPLGRLTAATGAGVNASYVYDASGERLARTVNGQTLYAIRSVGGQTLSEYVTACGSTALWARDLVYADGRLIGAVRADLTPPAVGFTQATASVAEGTGAMSVAVQLTTATGAPTTCPVTVRYAPVGGSASATLDFALTSGLLTFPTGAASGSVQYVTVPIVDDALDEDPETFAVHLSPTAGVTLAVPAALTVTVLDNDDPPLVTVASVSVPEGTGTLTALTFTLTLSAPSSRTVTVAYATADYTATAPADYTATSGVATFAPGLTSVTVQVPVVADADPEPHERLSFTLSAPVHATLARAIATGQIVDDDGGGWPPRDVNQDGWADLVLRHASTGQIGIWLMNGVVQTAGMLADPPSLPDLNWELRAVGDFNGDWKPDLVWQHRTNGQLAVWFFDGAVRIGTSYVTTLSGGVTEPDLDWTIVGAADMDRDGALDLVWWHQTTGALRVWHMSGAAQMDSVPLAQGVGASGWRIAGVADLNGDGWDDLVWRDYAVGGLAVWLMADTQVLSTQWLTPDSNADLSWRIVAVRDMNGDGQADLVWQHTGNGQVAAWLMQGLAVSGTTYLTPSVVADLNWRIVGAR